MARRKPKAEPDPTDSITFEFDNDGKTDENGDFSGAVVVAADCPPGVYKIVISDGENTAEAELEVSGDNDGPVITLDPETVELDGENEAEAEVTGEKFKPDETLTGTAEPVDQ